MKKKVFWTIFLLFFIAGFTMVAFATMVSDSFYIPTSVLSGGGTAMSSINFQMGSTLGQSSPLMYTEDPLGSENYDLSPGFWYTIDIEKKIIKIILKLPKGWSMISLSILPINALVQELFPGAMAIYGYKKGTGYVFMNDEEDLEVGMGYWILLNEEKSYTLTGHPIRGNTFSLNEDGWHMIGGCTYSAKVSINNGNIDVIYRYVPEAGYQRFPESENLKPGEGYWILLSDILGQAQLKVEARNL